MSSLVAFDSKGAFGPAMTLIYNSQYFNESALLALSNLLKANFLALANIKAKGKKEFCAFIVQKNGSDITPVDVINTKFFKSMQKEKPSHLHEKVLEHVVPRMMTLVQERISHAASENKREINEWTARFLESYMTETQILSHYGLKDSLSERILEERRKIGVEIYQLAKSEKLTEKDLDALIETCQAALKNLHKSDHFPSTLSLTGRYLTLFSMNEENPECFSENILDLLSTIFRAKMFHQI